MSQKQKQGWIAKLGGKGSGNWKTRWLSTEGTTLSYYKKEDKKTKLNTIELKDATSVRAIEHKKKPFTFEIVTPDRVWLMSCLTANDREEWIAIVSSMIQSLNPSVRAERTVTLPTKTGNRRANRTSMNLTNNDEWDSIKKKGDLPPIPDEEKSTGSEGKNSPRGARQTYNNFKRKKKEIGHVISKKQNLLKGSVIGKLYVSVIEGKFENVDPQARPLISAYFEKQLIDSPVSKNASNPKWKESFLFDVITLESKLRLKVYDSVKSDNSEWAQTKIPIKHLSDEKQHKQWVDVEGTSPGQLHISCRFETITNKVEETDVFEELEEVKGTAQLTIIGARDLKERANGNYRNAFVHLKYGKQDFKTEPCSNTLEPEWNQSTILRVRNDSATVVLRVLDMEKVARTHLGTVTMPTEMLMNSAMFEEPTDRWIKLKLEPEDNPEENHVGGELHIKYRFKPTGHVKEQAKKEIQQIIASTEIEVNFNDVPQGFPPAPSEPGVLTSNEKEEYKLWMKKKVRRETWENALRLYRKKESENDGSGMNAIIVKLKDELKAFEDIQDNELTVDFNNVPPEFPPAPPNVGNFIGNSPDEYKEYMKMKMLRELWENSLRQYRKKESEGDKEGMKAVIDTTRHQMKKIIPEPRGVRKGGEIQLGARKQSIANIPSPKESSENPFDDQGENSGENSNPFDDKPNSITTKSARSVTQRTNSENNKLRTNTASRNPRTTSSNDIRARAAVRASMKITTPIDFSLKPPSPQEEEINTAFNLDNTVDVDRRHDILYKIIIIGESGVGKTNLLGRWMDNKFASTSATINVEFAAKSFLVNDKVIKVQLWDTAGQEQYRAITRSYYRKASGAILVYDITNGNSFDRLEDWLADVKESPGNENTQVLLVGNKNDLEIKRDISTEKGIEFSRQHGLNFLEASALTGNNVNRAFQIVLNDIHKLSEKFSKLTDDPTKTGVDGKSTVVLTGESDGIQQDCCDTAGISNSINNSITTFWSNWNSS